MSIQVLTDAFVSMDDLEKSEFIQQLKKAVQYDSHSRFQAQQLEFAFVDSLGHKAKHTVSQR